MNGDIKILYDWKNVNPDKKFINPHHKSLLAIDARKFIFKQMGLGHTSGTVYSDIEGERYECLWSFMESYTL